MYRILIILCNVLLFGYANSATLTINKTYTQTTTLTSLSSVAQISSLSVTGSVVFHHDTSLVRILVRDAAGAEYMVYESYPLCATAKSISFTNEAEETNILKNIKPVAIVIIVKNASVTLQNVVYSTTATTKTESEVQTAQKANVQIKNAGKIARINANQAKYHCEWTTGQTQLAGLLFNVKKSYLGAVNDYNKSGYEFYKGGIFSRPRSQVTVLKSSSTSQFGSDGFVKEFDWRKLHNAHLSSSPYYDGDPYGGGWATSVKNQLWNNSLVCGSCWAHAAVGLVEMYANLYYNKHIDLDLSEQELVSCSKKDNCSSGFPADALDYILTYKIVDESCFQYLGYEQHCSKKCLSPTSKIGIISSPHISDVIVDHRASRSKRVKYALLQRGPVEGSHPGHSMVCVGWTTNSNGENVWIFKNSHGYDIGENGYSYEVDDTGYPIEYDDKTGEIIERQHFSEQLKGPLTGISDQVQCLDRDGDGYYNWGIGPKPSSCHPCAPDIMDYNDNDPAIAELDKLSGLIKPTVPLVLGADILIDKEKQSFTIWDVDKYLCGDLNVQYPESPSDGNSALRGLIFYKNLNMLADAKITVSNSTVKIIGGVVTNANINLVDSARIILADKAVVNIGAGDSFVINSTSVATFLESSFYIQ